MLAAPRRLVCRGIELARPATKRGGLVKRSGASLGLRSAARSSFGMEYGLKLRLKEKTRGYATSGKRDEDEDSMESWLEKAESFAVALGSERTNSLELIKGLAEEQHKAMKKALEKAIEAKKEKEKEAIFVALFQSLDLHHRRDLLRQIGDQYPEIMKSEAIVRSEVGILHAEAVCEIDPKRGLSLAVLYSDLLFALDDIPVESLIVSLVNIAMVLDSIQKFQDSIRVYKRALSIIQQPHLFVTKSSHPASSNEKSVSTSKSAKSQPESSITPSSTSTSSSTEPIESTLLVSENLHATVLTKLAEAILSKQRLEKEEFGKNREQGENHLSGPPSKENDAFSPSSSSTASSSASSSTQLSSSSSLAPQSSSQSQFHSDAHQYLESALSIRETILKRNMADEGARNAYVKAAEALSSLFNQSDAARRVWERASIVLEYGGDAAGWLSKELEVTQKELNEVQEGETSEIHLADLQHRHAKALLACNTRESLEMALKSVESAENSYRSMKRSQELLDTLEDKMAILESLTQIKSGNSGEISQEFVKEQIDIIGECLSLSGELNGPFSMENAKFLLNLSIFTSADRQLDRAVDLAKAAIYICEKAEVASNDEIYMRSKTVLQMLSTRPDTTMKKKKMMMGVDESKM